MKLFAAIVFVLLTAGISCGKSKGDATSQQPGDAMSEKQTKNNTTGHQAMGGAPSHMKHSEMGHHHHGDSADYIKRLDDPSRAEW
ncbi:hypothetical protein KJ865_04530, partial [Myxococcota bacterium]|nr:hypothetical protein [Myxococcota bacterium]